jgi:hypothetical protein
VMGLSSNTKAVFKEMEAEDRAVERLAHLPRQLQIVTVIKVAVDLAAAWEREKAEMLRRGDPRPVYLSTAEERFWLSSAATRYCEDMSWQSCPAAKVKDELSGLPADAAAFVAYKVARWVCRFERSA